MTSKSTTTEIRVRLRPGSCEAPPEHDTNFSHLEDRMASQYEIHSFGFADRSARVRWTLAELGLKVAQEHTLSWDNGDLDKPQYLALNPMGMSPTLIEDGKAIWESVACCVYLADKYSHLKALAPSLTSSHRAQYLQWTYFIAAEMDMKFNDLMMAHFSEDEARKKDAPMLAGRASVHGPRFG